MGQPADNGPEVSPRLAAGQCTQVARACQDARPAASAAGGLGYTRSMDIEFSGEIFHWRGPAPYLFVTVPEQYSVDIKTISSLVTYGWGVIPVHVRIGQTEWKTSLFPKNGLYLVPIKVAVQKAEKLAQGDTVTIRLQIRK